MPYHFLPLSTEPSLIVQAITFEPDGHGGGGAGDGVGDLVSAELVAEGAC